MFLAAVLASSVAVTPVLAAPDTEELESSKAAAQSEADSLQEQLTELLNKAGELEEEMIATGEKIIQAQDDLEAAQQKAEEQYASMKVRIQYMYENGGNNLFTYLAALVTGGISDMLNQVEYAESINDYDRQRLEEYKTSKATLEQQQADLADEQEALELLKTETEDKKKQVAQQQAATGSRISEYNSLISDLEGKIGDMDELIQEKTKILNELIAQAEEEERQARIQAAQNAASSMENVTIIAGDAQISDHQISLSDYELLMLATIIYCEAGNQSYEGQLAVGYVIMNRVRSSLYPSTLEGVLRQSKQFEPVGSGRFDLVLQAEQDDDIPDIVTQSCWNAAREVVNGSSNVGESLFFRTWAPVPSLITNLQNGGVPYWIIQDHIFYYYWTSYSTSTSTPSEDTEEEQEEEPEETEETEEPEESEQTETEDPAAGTDNTGTEDPAAGSDGTETTDPAVNTDSAGTTDPAADAGSTGTTDPAAGTDNTGTGDPASGTQTQSTEQGTN